MFPLNLIIVQIKKLEVALPLVAENTMLVVVNLLAQVMSLLLLPRLRMIPRRNVFLSLLFPFFAL
jgi:hypothetical protein